MEYPDFSNLVETINWLGAAGSAVWMLWFSKFFYTLRHPDLEKPFIQPVAWLSEQALKLSDFGALVAVTFFSFAIPALAALLAANVPLTVYDSLQPYYGYIVGLATVFIGQQIYHDFRPKF